MRHTCTMPWQPQVFCWPCTEAAIHETVAWRNADGTVRREATPRAVAAALDLAALDAATGDQLGLWAA